jgi:hypothetical protein
MATITTNSLGLRRIANHSCPVTNFSSTATTYTTIANTDMLEKFSAYPTGTKAEIIVFWTNNTASRTNYIQLYDQAPGGSGAVVSGSELTQAITTPGTYQIVQTSVPFTLPTGLTSLMVQIKGSAAGTMTVKKVEVNIIFP